MMFVPRYKDKLNYTVLKIVPLGQPSNENNPTSSVGNLL